MRWCSRCSAGDISTSAGFGGVCTAPCGAAGEDGTAVQAASTSATIAAATPTSGRLAIRAGPSPLTPSPALVAVGCLDLLWINRLDPWSVPRAAADPAPCLDPSADPQTSASESLQVEIRRGEATFVSLPDRNRKVLGPMVAEIDINRGAAFVHRNHLTLDKHKSAPLRQYIRGTVGLKGVKERARPKAEPGLPGRVLKTLKFHRTIAAADVVANSSKARHDQPRLHQSLGIAATCHHIGHDPTIAVGG